MLNVSVESIVKNLGENVKFVQPLFESITNSLESGSTKIDIELYGSEILGNDFVPSLVGFSITDNGQGFTRENIDSFCTLWSGYKAELGCRGSGRFTWLTVFNEINITSFIAETKTKVTIPFSKNFSATDVKCEKCDSIEDNITTIVFKYVTEKYYKISGKKKVDKRILINLETIKKSIVDYLFLKLSFCFESNPEIVISISFNDSTTYITKSDVNSLDSISFNIVDDVEGTEHVFELKYVFVEDGKNNRNFILCSNKRSGHNIQPSSVHIYDKLPNSDSLMFYVTSDYLDRIDTDSRTGLDEYSSLKTVDILHSIPYSKLLNEISHAIREIIIERYNDLEKINNKVISDVKNEYPYLSNYIDDIPVTIASKKVIENEANKAFSTHKIEASERFEIAFSKRNIDPEGFNEAIKEVSSVSAAELCEYILYRSKIIKALSSEKLIDKKEKYIHDIFMPMHSSSNNSDYLETNLWILDDKFMSYVYASSDLSFLKINKEFKGDSQRSNHDSRRPDMFIAYNRNEGKRNAVLIEFKAYNASFDEKNKSMLELPNNIGELRRSRNDIETIWAYIITKIDDDFLESINDQPGYKPVYTSEGKGMIFHNYLDKPDAHLYIYVILTQ